MANIMQWTSTSRLRYDNKSQSEYFFELVSFLIKPTFLSLFWRNMFRRLPVSLCLLHFAGFLCTSSWHRAQKTFETGCFTNRHPSGEWQRHGSWTKVLHTTSI